MPYSSTVLTQTGNALSLEMRDLLDGALTTSGKYTKVTSAYVSTTKTFDVWKNDGTTDGYEWYLIVCTDTANTGRVYVSGALEYSDATKLAKKALRGVSGTGFLDSNGYPLVSAGGAEMTFALGNFAVTTSQSIGSLSAAGSSHPTAAAAGNIFKVMVSGQAVWVYWGSASAFIASQGVGTYQTMHGIAGQDSKPLAFMGHSNAGSGGGSVWQHPSATYTYPRQTGSYGPSGQSGLLMEAWTHPIGKLGSSGQDMNYGSNYVGSRIHIVRDPTAVGGGTSFATLGWSLGLGPADFLIFGRQSSVAIGDTITVNGKVYTSVSTPSVQPGLFINTQPV